MSFILRDCETREKIEFPDDTVCACCGRTHNPAKKIERLVIDHDRWVVPMVTRILCGLCNIKKGPRRYVSFYDTVWFPGMAIGERKKIKAKAVDFDFFSEKNRRTSEAMKAWWKRLSRLLDKKLGVEGAIR